MTLEELTTHVADKLSIPKSTATSAIHETVSAITVALTAGDKIGLPGLGNFSVTQRGERKGRNPQTGAEIVIAAKKVVKFSPATAVSKAVNA